MAFQALMNDTVDLRKNNGEITGNLKASVQGTKIYMNAGKLLIESGDVIVRRASNGLVEAYEVVDPGFREAFHGIPATYQMIVKKAIFPLPSSATGSTSALVSTGVDTLVHAIKRLEEQFPTEEPEAIKSFAKSRFEQLNLSGRKITVDSLSEGYAPQQSAENVRDPSVPNVFISYSHDTSEHKQWVLKFAMNLAEKGIHVMLDQWDLRPGSDLAAYMNKSVRSADRVLMICTKKYTEKANGGIGGVGYEQMIVSGELLRELGTSKFIPVVRQTVSPPDLPTAFGSRIFINMNDGPHLESEWETLLRELHGVPETTRPPIGKSPYLKAAITSTDGSSGGFDFDGEEHLSQ